MKTPLISSELLEWLEGLFPDTVPVTDSLPELYRAQGEQKVLRKIRAEHRNQNDPTYE
jgi:hypothetical protein